MSDAAIDPASLTRPGRRRLVMTLALSLTASMMFAPQAPASVEEPTVGPAVEQVEVVPHTDVPLARRAMPKSPGGGERQARAWPAGDTAEVALPRPAAGKAAKPLRAGSLPIALAATKPGASRSTKDTVDVRLAEQTGAQRAGVTGLLFSLRSAEKLSTSVTVDYSSFRYASGADLGSRLRLVSMPPCAITTPEVAECQVRTPLPSRNDATTQTVSADVDISADAPVILAAAADAGGPQGTFEASSLAPSGTWSVGGSSGAFSWSYPITVPPVAAGGAIAPKVALGYGSSGVDGQTAGTNNQPSWIGQGWDYTPGYIERTYRGCFDDENLPEAQRTGDLCWAGQIVTMSLNGQSVSLVYDDNNHTWHPSDDSGAKVELLTNASNGVVNGEYWKITTIDGIQYFFGRNGGPGYTNQELTNSAWTVPVYGPRAGDPCNNPAGFAQSSCKQAWRWNLDFVQDTHGAVTAYYYAPETGYYGANKGTAGVDYIRGGTLKRIDYGLREVNGSIYGQTVPGQVAFSVTERCDATATFTCDPAQFNAANASHWPDTPQDQQCAKDAVCNNHSPSFWTTQRLATITTQYDIGAGPATVDTYQLTQSFSSIGDPALRLDKIVRTGNKPGSPALTLPPIEFTYQLLDNRVPGYNSQPAMAHWRLTNVATDTGSIVSITYNTPECGLGNMPTDPANIARLCFPVYWTLPYNTNPILDYFHKYVVTKVEVQDRNGISPTQVTSYNYIGTPAWHYDDNELVKPKLRTYGQFRGFQQVEVRAGGGNDQKTLTRTTYYRGMNDDILPGGRSREATVPNSLGETSVVDNNLYAGQAHEVQTFASDGGQVLSTMVTEPTTIGTTATRNRPGLRPLTANVVNTQRTREVTTLAAGGTRTATKTYGYDAIGRKIATTDSGTDVPDICTTLRYADNTTSWIRDHISETITSQQACPAPDETPTPVLSATRAYYDNATTLGEVPGAGDATCTEKAIDNTEDTSEHATCDNDTSGTLTYATVGTTAYDALGRVTTATDANQHTIHTAYTPADGGIVSKIAITNAKNQTASKDLEPSRGLTTGSADVGGRRTDATYDALGRLTELWKPGRAKGQVSANATYVYLQRTDGPLARTTKTLVDYGDGTNYVTKIDLFDAFGQLRQTQADDISNPAGVSSRVVKDVFYDSHGWAVRTNNRYVTAAPPRTTLISVGDSEVDDRTIIEYDGAGRAVKTTSYERLTKKWEARTIHGGDRTTMIPPEGGVTATTLADIRGHNTEIRQYTAAPTVTGNVVSGGDFEPTTLRYNALGQLTGMTDAASNQWTYGYDRLGRRTTATDPDSGTTTSTYDLTGQLTSTTDARGQVLTYTYDPLGRKTAEYNGSTGSKLAEWFYDNAAANGVGLPASTVRYTPQGNFRIGVSHYNGAGLPSNNVVQIPASVTGLAGTYQTNYSYTSTGLPRVVEPAVLGGLPAEDIIVDYDRYGQPSTSFGYNSIVSLSSYTPYGEPAKYTLGTGNSTGSLTFAYDRHTRALSGMNLSVQQAWSQIDDLRYTRDQAGNITKIVNVQGSPGNNAPTRTQCFDYDALNRLTQAWTTTNDCDTAPSAATVGGVDPYWTSWDINEIGLRRAQTRHATGGDTTTTYTYPPSGDNAVRPHALSGTTTTGPNGTSTTNYDYNPTGDVTTRELPAGDQTLTWNENNRLATATTPAGTTSYGYDADGNQLIRTDPDTTALYLPMQDIVRDNTTGTLTGTRYYTHNGTTVAMRVGGNNLRYVQSDQHNTAQVTVTTPGFEVTRRTFDPYGNPIGAGQGLWPDSRGFLNLPHNPVTGLTDIGARKYDPTTGTFISVDPVLDTANPQQWNPYAYSNNNPVTYSDPSGLYCDMCNFYADPGDPEVGVGCPPCTPNPNPSPNNDPLSSGQNTDPRKQPTVGDRRVPTYEELKNRPGFAHYRSSGTYQEAISDWAKEICSHAIEEDQQFCSVASDNGWLEPSNPALHQFLFGLTPISDLIDCVGGSAEGCVWLLANFVPGAKGIKAADDLGDAAHDAGRAADTCVPNSFVSGTQVLMADGSRKAIEDIRIGDQVLATDPETGETGPRSVEDTIVGAGPKNLVFLTVDTGGPNGTQKATIIATANHPIWVTNKERWTAAGDIHTGDGLLGLNDARPKVLAADSNIEYRTVYNLSVDDIRTYYVLVGGTPVLVHNCPAANALNAAEQATLDRMNSIFPSEDLRGVNAPDADFVGKSGKYDAMGAPGAFQNWGRQRGNFLAQIPRHAHKSDFAIVDMTGASRGQINDVMSYYGTLDRNTQNRLIIIDGTKILN